MRIIADHVGLVALAFSGFSHVGLAWFLRGERTPVHSRPSVEIFVEVQQNMPEKEPPPEPVSEPAPRDPQPSHPTRAMHTHRIASNQPAVPHDPKIMHDPSVGAAAEAPAVVASSAPASFTLPLGQAVGTSGVVSTSGAASVTRGGLPAPEQTLPESKVSTPARLLSSAVAEYPALARQAELEASVPVEIVVDASGRVVEARSLSHIGYQLDEAAVRAVKGYLFSPALRDGRPVRVRMRWLVHFRLR
jgi:protein TonB